ncbi:isochorismatase family protein [Chengkuizengella axinellae]|uniref:Isochorismatase family protein n=1 Tax=Chengkuizengella axinellae TaxID=3064388 RepID=A0ABT9J6D4_9BACL|nr:isochorismatase family protein [Chengkuizengella sp. 2205SS18-9]MDP5277181.1 isochorismatase family protein [Chengkuizengella sp. 2205SS18-9]
MSPIKKQALIIIDAQQELIEGNLEESSVFNKENLIKNINLVIEKAVKDNIQILFIRDTDVCEGKGEGFQIHQNIHIPTHATIFDKKATNAFHRTELKSYLESKEIEHIVIMGCKTEYCIDTAVRAATVNNLDVTLVSDGHSTTNTSVLSAEQIINHHNEILHGHYNVDHFSIVRSAKDDLFVPTHDSYR